MCCWDVKRSDDWFVFKTIAYDLLIDWISYLTFFITCLKKYTLCSFPVSFSLNFLNHFSLNASSTIGADMFLFHPWRDADIVITLATFCTSFHGCAFRQVINAYTTCRFAIIKILQAYFLLFHGTRAEDFCGLQNHDVTFLHNFFHFSRIISYFMNTSSM